jgi:DNA-binding transcriptional LysR family regulator
MVRGAAVQWGERIGRRLKLRDLHILLAVAKSGSMGKAASELAMSQPAVSKAIADLEHTLGVPVLDRGPKGVEPTDYGRALLKCGVAVFDDLRQGIKAIEFIADPTAGELSIGCTEPLAAGFVAAIIDRLSPRYPKAVFNVVTADLVLLRDRELRERKIDLAVMPRMEPAPQPDLHAEPLFDDRHVVLAPAKSKWARRRNLTLAELVAEPWVLPPPDSVISLHLTAAFRAAGLEPPAARVVTFSIPLHQSLLATGRFLTALPVSMLHHHAYFPFKVLPIKFPASPRSMGIVTLKNRTLSPLAVRFIECAREVAKSLPKR